MDKGMMSWETGSPPPLDRTDTAGNGSRKPTALCMYYVDRDTLCRMGSLMVTKTCELRAGTDVV